MNRKVVIVILYLPIIHLFQLHQMDYQHHNELLYQMYLL